MITSALNGLTLFLKPYQLSRITTWLNPEQYALTSGYQIIQALTAFATGNFWGVGFGNSKQKFCIKINLSFLNFNILISFEFHVVPLIS